MNSKINEFYLELGVLTKIVTVMLLIVLAEAALRWNFVFWSYFVVIFRVGVDVLYRRAIRTSGILPVKSFSQPLGCQKFVKKLFAFFSKEKATKKPIVSFDRVYQRTSKALGMSYTSVHRIMNDKRPCKSNRLKERAKILDDFDHCVIKRTIHGKLLRPSQ